MSVLAPLGRLRQWDDKNLDHLLPRKAVPKEVRRKYWSIGQVLDQGNTPMCVGYAGWGWLRGGPVINRPPFTPEVLYHWAQDEDEWPGSNYEGSSTLGLMKALQKRGYIKNYKWALEAEPLVAWLLTTGPVLAGTNWTLDMFKGVKTSHGYYLEPTGSNEGGHEWRIRGADRDRWTPDGSKGAVRMVNSWGKGWLEGGQARVSFRALDQLIKDQGEAVTSTEIKLP